MKSIVWDFGKVEGLLVGMGVVKAGGMVWNKGNREVDEYSNGRLLVDDKENIDMDIMTNTKGKSQQGTKNSNRL